MADKSWKRFERKIAKMLGVRRTPLSGGNSAHTRSDTLHDSIFVECKQRKSMAVHNLYRSTKELALKEGKVPIIVTRESGKKTTLITLELENLKYVASQIKEDS